MERGYVKLWRKALDSGFDTGFLVIRFRGIGAMFGALALKCKGISNELRTIAKSEAFFFLSSRNFRA